LCLENFDIIAMCSNSYEIKELGKTSNLVSKLITFRDKYLISGDKNGLVEFFDIKKGKVIM